MTALEADITCPNCQKNFRIPLVEMRPGTSRACPHCRTPMQFAGQDPSKIQSIIDKLSAQGVNVSVEVDVKTERRRPWWKFWGA